MKRDRALWIIVFLWLLGIALHFDAVPSGPSTLVATLAVIHFLWPYLAAGLILMCLNWLIRDAVAAGIAKGLETLDISAAVEQGIRNAKDDD